MYNMLDTQGTLARDTNRSLLRNTRYGIKVTGEREEYRGPNENSM